MGTNTNDDQVPVEVRLAWLREERDFLVAAVSWLDEPEVLWDALASLRELEGQIAELEQARETKRR